MPPNIFNIRYMKSQMIHSLTWNKMSIFKEISKTFCFLSLQHFLFIPYFPAYSSSFNFLFNRLLFTAVLSSQQNGIEGTEISQHMPCPTSAQISLNQYPPLREVHLLQLMSLRWCVINTQNPEFTSGFRLGAVHSIGLGTFIMTYTHFHKII